MRQDPTVCLVEDYLFEISGANVEFFENLQDSLLNPANGYPKERCPMHAKCMFLLAQPVG